MKKILIIEDYVDLSDMYALMFRAAGYEVEQAFDGVEGLKKADSCHPDIILLDIMMPKMSGHQVFEHLEKECQKLPLIVVCSNAMWTGGRPENLFYLKKQNYTPTELIVKIEEFWMQRKG